MSVNPQSQPKRADQSYGDPALKNIANIIFCSNDLLVVQTYAISDLVSPAADTNVSNANANANNARAWDEQTLAPSYGGFNLGLHVGDESQRVHRHRCHLLRALNDYLDQQQIASVINRIHWVNQVHGNLVADVTDSTDSNDSTDSTDARQPALSLAATDADAMVTCQARSALAIMTADCVPIVLYQPSTGQIAAIHAGWQGLANGVIAATAERFESPKPIYAWMGACISQLNYEVSKEVADTLTTGCIKLGLVSLNSFEALYNEITASGYNAQQTLTRQAATDAAGKVHLDLPKLAALQLEHAGIQLYSDKIPCSYSDQQYYSYRQQTHEGRAATGRMALLIAKL